MNIKKSILLRVRIAFLLVALFSTAVIARIVDLQWVQGGKWRQLGEDIGLQYRKVKATRGNIYSDNGSLLATSLPFYKVAFDPTVADDDLMREGIDSLSLLLSHYFKNESAKAYKRKILEARKEGRQYMVLSNQLVGYQAKKKMEGWPIFRHGRMSGGVIFEKTNKRFRPFSYMAFRTIGFVNKEHEGAGLEYSFNKMLHGREGEALYQKMAGGNWKPLSDDSEIHPKDGYDIETTLNVNIQDVSESALLGALQEHDADMGCVVVMEVKTGEIKAMANLKKIGDHKYAEVYNYAVGRQGLREPGSTFKLASYMAMFEETNKKVTDSIKTGDGTLKFYNEEVRDHKPGGYGTLTLEQAFAFSSNIAAAKLADETFGKKPQRFLDYLNSFGMTKPLGFQIDGEGVPNIPPLNEWSGITLPWMAYGYGLEVTPLQTLTLYNAVANNGKMIRPIIVRSIRKADRTVEKFHTTTINDKICSDETLAKVKDLLESVVKYGTAKNISNAHYSIAGKTGTAQILKNGRYVQQYYTSFVGYFPADKPKYSCIVVMDNPKGYYHYGSDVAAPVFKEIADKIYSLDIKMHDTFVQNPKPEFGIFPVIQAGNQTELSMICNKLGVSNHAKDDEAHWVSTDTKGNAVIWKPQDIKPGVVPDVRGMTLRDAIYLLENAGLKVKIEGTGRVVQQSQLPGARALDGSTIKITLG